MMNLEDEDKEVIVSVVENFVSSAARDETVEEGHLTKMGESMDEYLRIVEAAAKRMPTTKFSIVDPINRKLSNKDTSAHAVPFISRPVMHVRPTETSEVWSPPKTFSFVEAAVRFGHLVKQVELGEAYRRAGNSFKGQLEQHFLLLRESASSRPQHQQQHTNRGGGFRAPGGRQKRPREEDDDEDRYTGQGSSRGYRPPARGSYGQRRGYNKKHQK
jgi:hypothetical protein